MESLNSNSQERKLPQLQLVEKQLHSICMTRFEQLEIHLSDLYHNNLSHDVDAFKPAFRAFFGEEHQTFRLKMFHNLDQLRLQLKERIFMRLMQRIVLSVIKYGELQMKENEVNALNKTGKQLNAEILHGHELEKSFKLESKDVQINLVQAVDANLVFTKSSGIESINNSSENALSKSVNETQMQLQEEKVDMGKALDDGLVVIESSRTKSDKQNTSSRSGNYTTHVVNEDIRLVNDQEPFAEVQLIAQHNVLANDQQHSKKSEPIYDTYLLEKVDSNTIPDSTSMCNRGREIYHNAKKCQVTSPSLDPLTRTNTGEQSYQSLEFENISLKKTVTQFQKDFSRMEAHCVNLELKYQNQA
uniref:Integrase, catalytic region, zinc finger, CCHC-type, peptidase aspartic, catalytic n=1 Tax=Tanacetum cinerariifolium TaxID=118510 RepID=A0A6L2L6D2_TANCI|nr:hypothetical protein [Tanacetum cinerariifolium]